MPKREYKLSNRYNVYDIKDCLDEALVEIVENRGAQQHMIPVYLKLLIGFIMISFPAYSFYYRNDYPKNYTSIVVCTVGYIIFSAIYTAYEWFCEKNAFFSGYYDPLKRKGVVMRSTMGQYDSTYNLVVEEQVGGEWKTHQLPIEISKVFDSEGNLHLDILKDLHDSKLGKREKEEEKPGKKKIKKK